MDSKIWRYKLNAISEEALISEDAHKRSAELVTRVTPYKVIVGVCVVLSAGGTVAEFMTKPVNYFGRFSSVCLTGVTGLILWLHHKTCEMEGQRHEYYADHWRDVYDYSKLLRSRVMENGETNESFNDKYETLRGFAGATRSGCIPEKGTFKDACVDYNTRHYPIEKEFYEKNFGITIPPVKPRNLY